MPSLHVRNIEEGLIAQLKRRAARHGRSAEAEHRQILRDALLNDAEPSFEQFAASIRQRTKGRAHTPAEVLVRESRDER